MLDKITLHPPEAAEPVLQKLEQYGIAVLPGFVPSRETSQLRAECLNRLDSGEKNPKVSRLGRLVRRLLLRSPFNLARYNLCEDNYVNDRFKTRAQTYSE